MSYKKDIPSSELLEWMNAVQGVKRIDHNHAETKQTPNPKDIIIKQPTVIRNPHSKRRKTNNLLNTFMEIDRATQRKITQEEIKIDARLDLHGYSESDAYNQVVNFINSSYNMGLRLLLIITGKGQKSQGSLKMMLPKWLENHELASKILRFGQSQQKHGGEGAYYIYLKKNQ